MNNIKSKSDRELLVYLVKECAIATLDRKWIKKAQDNHLAHHWYLEGGIVLVLVLGVLSKLFG